LPVLSQPFKLIEVDVSNSTEGDSQTEGSMSLLAWIALGLISGFIASTIVNKSGPGVVMNIVLGIVGAIAGGWFFNTIGQTGATGVNLYSILVAVVGAVIVLFIYHALIGSHYQSRTPMKPL
jgi:uncharacterized membrane protein YeaQ/YmgE (transglycosylase-associated protein family)